MVPELFAHFFEVLGAQHAGVLGRLVGVVGEDVPGGELERREAREGHDLPDGKERPRAPALEAQVAELRERADRDRLVPLLASITPAMRVVATAPRPGRKTAS